MLARLDMQMAVVTKELVNLTPPAARASMFGVWRIALPAQLIESQRWSSVTKTMRFGLRRDRPPGGGVIAARLGQGLASGGNATAAPMQPWMNRRRLNP